ncbi:MAG TPA: efflux RND transporter permease subunit [Anaerovoracaceae bacterium]|nr:efflux RND transporter permease subunit [Anaerovoracaceae bacterium]
MNFSKISVMRPVSTIMLMMIIVVLGAVSFSRLPIDLYPKMELPYAMVMIQYPNAAPTEIENMVTKPVEQQIATVENIKGIYSYSMEGTAIVLCEFENGTDMNFASLNMREKVALISDYLPDNASEPMFLTMDPTLMPVSQLYVSGDMSLEELNALVEDEVLPQFERSEGVAAASSFGGLEKEISVKFDQERLAGYGLTLSDISQMLAAENISLPSGDVKQGARELVVRTIGEFQSLDDIKHVPFVLPTREVVYLQDLATVEEAMKEQTSIGRVNQVPSIGISITKQSTANTVVVSNQVNQAIEDLKLKHPELAFTFSYDQADYIEKSITNVAETAILSCVIAVFICFLFLRNVASTMIIAISIPTSIVATFILMYFTGLTMNILSLSGLAVAIGLLVDDSIVVMENIYRRRDEGMEAMEASIVGTKEVTMPVFAATLTKIAVFLPIVFVEGIAATMFKEFSFTISFALLCSLLIALTVVPMLCSRLLNTKDMGTHLRVGRRRFELRFMNGFTRGMAYLTEEYLKFLKYSLHHRKKIMIWSLVILIASSVLVAFVGGELMPTSDEGSFTITAEMPYGTSLEDTDKTISQIEKYVIDNIPELDICSVAIGSSNMYSISSANSSTVTVKLVDKQDRKRSTTEIVNQTTLDLQKSILGAKLTLAESSSMSMSMGSSPISLVLKGDDLETLKKVSTDIEGIVKGVNGTINVTTDMTEGNPELRVMLQRNNAAQYGITSYQLAKALEAALDGATATTLKTNGEETDIVLSLDDAYQESVENLKQIVVSAPTGRQVTVGEIADFAFDNSPSQITRQDQVRTVTISSNISGRDLQSVSNDINKALEKYQLPAGYTIETGGEQEEMLNSFTSLGYALLLSLLLIYMILASQFESLLQPLIIMMAIPFALTGAFMALFLTGTPLSLVAFLGLIMLSGIVVNNSILLIDFINKNKMVYPTREEAIINAGRFRIRPIMMTMLVACLGLLPLSFGIGSGGELQAPMGITVIGGLLFSTVITLVIVPVIYTIMDDRHLKRIARKAEKKARKSLLTQEEA